MNSIPFQEVLHLLRAGALVYTLENGHKTFFALRDGILLVRSPNYSARLSVEDWTDLYQKNLFYLYEEESDQFIDPEKDREYYSWRHK